MYESDARESVIHILQKNGITVTETMIPWDNQAQPKRLAKKQASEEIFAAAVLGKVNAHASGIVSEYEGESGCVQFFRTGEFQIAFSAGLPIDGKDKEEHAMSFLKKLGIESEVIGIEQDIVTLRQLYEDLPVFSCDATVEYRDGLLYKVRGWCLFGETEQGQDRALQAETLLLRFMESVADETTIVSIIPGYAYHTNLSLATTLTPVWYIQTNSGAYQMNCVTGGCQPIPKE
ncbi:MAG: hypothetical protein RR053_00505 [Evtepia sp.]